MAKAETVSEVVKIKLLDDETEVTLRPLSIRRLREFMAEFNKVGQIEMKEETIGDEFMTVLVNCAAIALRGQLPEQTEFLEDEKASRDDFEDLVDMNIVHKVNEVCGGIGFGGGDDGPNPQAARVEAGTA